jgi:hypothetical protein
MELFSVLFNGVLYGLIFSLLYMIGARSFRTTSEGRKPTWRGLARGFVYLSLYCVPGGIVLFGLVAILD